MLKKLSVFILLAYSQVSMADNQVTIETFADQRCVTTNSLPDHPAGPFRNGTQVKALTQKLCITTHPVKGKWPKKLKGAMGVALNGIQFKPNTSGFFDPNSPRGHGRNGDKNWSFDLAGAPKQRGLDANNAHVGKLGSYHYHNLPTALVKAQQEHQSSLIGYAADGFEIHYVGDNVQSGYELKQGQRPTKIPSGDFDGTYNEDYEFNTALGLDECNMGQLEGKSVYFLTNSYPFIPRCLWGEASDDFVRKSERGNRVGHKPRFQRQG